MGLQSRETLKTSILRATSHKVPPSTSHHSSEPYQKPNTTNVMCHKKREEHKVLPKGQQQQAVVCTRAPHDCQKLSVLHIKEEDSKPRSVVSTRSWRNSLLPTDVTVRLNPEARGTGAWICLVINHTFAQAPHKCSPRRKKQEKKPGNLLLSSETQVPHPTTGEGLGVISSLG